MNFERNKDPKSSMSIGINNLRTGENLRFLYHEILNEFKGRPHPLKKETIDILYNMIPAGYKSNHG